MKAVWKVIDSRLGISRLAYHVPEHGNTLPYVLGGMALGCFVILAVTGIFMAQFYNPSPDSAHQSIVYMVTKVPFGDFLRNLHYWTANFFILVLLLHLARVFISGSYKKPRELTWLTGLMLFALALGFFFTGTVLKQDQEAVEALTHNIGIGELMGGIGVWFTPGFSVGVSIVARVFFAHITILVFFFLAVLALHLYLIKLHGISPKPTIDAVSRSTAGEGKSYFTVHLKKLLGYSLPLFAFLGVLAILFPAPLGAPGVFGVETTKPPWPFLPFYGMEDIFGFPAIIWGPAILFILLALVPFIDRNPSLSPRRRKPMMVFGAVVLVALIGFGIEGYLYKTGMPEEGFSRPQPHGSFLEPISKIPPARVASDFLVSARRGEEGVARATQTKPQHSGTRKSPQPAWDMANFRTTCVDSSSEYETYTFVVAPWLCKNWLISRAEVFLRWVPVVPRAYAHGIPMITIRPDKLLPGGQLTINADGASETGIYAVSIEGESGTIMLGSATVAEGGDSFDASFTLPESTPPGNYVVKAAHESGNHTLYSLLKLSVVSPNAGAEEPSMDAKAMPLEKNTLTPIELTIIVATLALAVLGGAVLMRAKP
ncbi:MAG: hypothetical protein A2945_03410 [Candidatus Liptonbacteria bacterium RIFCSPLOWO2_01_FULL_52_25]|uniref:Cytochrome b/b6 N-terminal region profile domain-containing protein n=1 Tax=Candidatus Liptonbacteria bacterium RIFCSPLOWO2_01_FULL_52_25 TaxID=1798650 RepID=A0A1G2CI15_9BACT|nr:MAG: hypothetical protein A2945_03410 [Candidatus Liptonbacteria bacterium RIFCSPLOWO2_01_FULL_52_25]